MFSFKEAYLTERSAEIDLEIFIPDVALSRAPGFPGEGGTTPVRVREE